MNGCPRFVDLHCHLLPGIDDGPESWEVSLDMARAAVAEGIGTVVCTPHQLGKHSDNTGERIRPLVSELQDRLRAEEIPLRVLPGGDVRIEAELVSKVLQGEVVSLADRRRHVLLELPHDLYLPLDRLLEDLSAAGLVGVLSHPERNRGLLRDPSVLRPLVEAGCLMQVTAGSVMGDFGGPAQQLAQSMIEQGLVHFLATDAHNTRSRPPSMRPAYERVCQWVGEEAAARLCAVHPARVVEGRDLPSRPPAAKRKGLSAWLGWK